MEDNIKITFDEDYYRKEHKHISGNIIKYITGDIDENSKFTDRSSKYFITTNNTSTMVDPNHIIEIGYIKKIKGFTSVSYEEYTCKIEGSQIDVDKYINLGYDINLENVNNTIELFITNPNKTTIVTETLVITSTDLSEEKNTKEHVINLKYNDTKGGKKRSSKKTKKTQKKVRTNKRKTSKKSKLSKRK